MYDAKHSIKAESNKKATLMLGPDDFPFPIPLVNTKTGWEFDTSAGRSRCFIAALGAMSSTRSRPALAYVDAQNEYADKDRGEGAGVYAQRIVSTPGKKDGLFWRDDADPSPLGALAAEASPKGTRLPKGAEAVSRILFPDLEGAGL